jgi:1-deoxy-D-xylulose-5-phosphate reductoisomerase
MNQKVTISILGSTGSIGSSTVSLLENELKGLFEVNALSFHKNAKLALKQAVSLNAKEIIATNHEGFEEIKTLLPDGKIKISFGEEALKRACQNPQTRVILIAIVGIEGLAPMLDSITEYPRVIAIANKEAIICGWHLAKEKLKTSQTRLIPVDSEHNSLFRILQNVKKESVESVFITASGGAFYGRKFMELENVSIKEVIKHPVWNMGSKISVDSSTMANKGLELLEAANLFDLKENQIKTFICKGSILHAGVSLKDKSDIWFLSSPNMKNHISYAILDGEALNLNLPSINPVEMEKIEFYELKKDEFPIFFIAKEICKNQDTGHAIAFNILNELAVEKFLQGHIKYTAILNLIEENISYNPLNFTFKTIEEIYEFKKILKMKLL